MTGKAEILPSFQSRGEPELLFHPTREDDRHVHPLKGLVNFGPYSRAVVGTVLDPIRVGGIVPYGYSTRLKALLNEIEATHTARERRQYLPDFPGFSRVFGIRAVPAKDSSWYELPKDLETQLHNAPKAHLLLAERLTQALSVLDAVRSEYDILLVLLPTVWAPGFYGRDEEDFDLHDHLKATAAARGLPIQLIREDKSLSYSCRCSVAWRLGIAIYCKAGGMPWRLAAQDKEAAFVGISYALRPNPSGGKRFVTCCSQVFDAGGTGLEFLLYEPGDLRVENDNPYLSRSEMRRVMARSLSLYQRRHGGCLPRRVTIHKTTEFRPEEADGCFDAWKACDGLELIQVQQDVTWRGILIQPPKTAGTSKGEPSDYPVLRGTCLQLGGRDVLLWTQGNCPQAAGGHNYFKEGKSIPSPLWLKRFAGHGGWERSCDEILGLTKMNWNNDGLYDRLPVTMGFASILARTVKRMSNLSPTPYQFRFFM